MINLLYPSTISIHRLKTVAGSDDAIGGVGYSGAEQSTSPSDPQGETVLFSGVAANINAASTGLKGRKVGSSALPGDAVSQPSWYILPAPGSLALGTVRDRDIIYDDENYRYEVGQAEFGVNGYNLICIRVEA